MSVTRSWWTIYISSGSDQKFRLLPAPAPQHWLRVSPKMHIQTSSVTRGPHKEKKILQSKNVHPPRPPLMDRIGFANKRFVVVGKGSPSCWRRFAPSRPSTGRSKRQDNRSRARVILHHLSPGVTFSMCLDGADISYQEKRAVITGTLINHWSQLLKMRKCS
jgi:hypothetical protein